MSCAVGTKINDAVLLEYERFRKRGGPRTMILKMNDTFSEIVVDKMIEKDEDVSLDDMVIQLPKDGCRYVFHNFSYELEDGGKRWKTLFFLYTPSRSSIKQKLLLASAASTLTRSLNGSFVNFQGGSIADLNEEEVTDKLLRSFR